MPTSLSEADFAAFARFGVGPELLAEHCVQRVTDAGAREFGITGGGDLSGVLFPYYLPWNGTNRVTCRIRRDHPEIENGKIRRKYLSAYGDRHHLYFPVGGNAAFTDTAVPLVLVEAEKSALALLAWSRRTGKKICPVAMGGAWGWKGRIGIKTTSTGERVPEKGPLPDLNCVTDRHVVVMLDSNAATSPEVQIAQRMLVRELLARKAKVLVAMLPSAEGVNGPDDHIGRFGDKAMFDVLAAAIDPRIEAATDATEEDVATKFSDHYQDELRYLDEWHKWLRWDGCTWRNEPHVRVWDNVRDLCKRLAQDSGDPKLHCTFKRSQFVQHVEWFARTDRRHFLTVEQLDRDPWALNTPGGVVDLRTGEVRPNQQTDYLIKCTAVEPSPTPPKLWLEVLKRITGGDQQRIDYLQRVSGYALTGSIKEEALFFAYGPGANGKDVYFSTELKIIGDYGQVAPMEMFTESKQDRHPTELAALRGARLVIASETERGRRWAESRIKMLTGGNRIRARKMHCDEFEFDPQFKLVLYGNYKPHLRGVTESVRRRFHIIPFDVIIPPAERDPNLKEKLVAEWPSILHWFIEGCLEWQRVGLADPESVIKATAAYFSEQDAIGRWLEECCQFDPRACAAKKDLFESYARWCEVGKEHAQSKRDFLNELLANHPELDEDRKGDARTRVVIGLRLLTDATDSHSYSGRMARARDTGQMEVASVSSVDPEEEDGDVRF